MLIYIVHLYVEHVYGHDDQHQATVGEGHIAAVVADVVLNQPTATAVRSHTPRLVKMV